MQTNQPLPTLRAPDQIAPLALVVGDLNRAADAARLLDRAEEVGNFREYRTFTGFYQGQRVTVSSHGVGAGGANMCFHELFRAGVKTIIRAGTCGGMLPNIQDGDLIVGAAAVREDGVSEHMVPLSYPAVADLAVTNALEAVCRSSGAHFHTGVILTQSYFYPGMLPNETDLWLPGGMVAGVEMEYALLLVMAGLNHACAGGLFVSDGNLTRTPDPDAYNPHRKAVDDGKALMLRVALETLAALA